MKKPLLNRLSILFVIVVSAAAIFGIVRTVRNRQLVASRATGEVSSSVKEASSNGFKVEPPRTSSQSGGIDGLSASTTPTRPPVVKKKAERKERGGAVRDSDGDRETETISEEGEGDSGARESSFYEERAYPLKTIPLMARANAIDHMESEQRRLGPIVRKGINAQFQPQALPSWQALGPRPIGQGQTSGNPRVPVSGRVSAIALDPGYNGTSNKTLYVGGAQGGVWKSVDNGTTWTPILDDQASLAIGSIAVDPTNPNTIYVGSGETNYSGDSYYGAGLFKTTNGGVTWTQIKGPKSNIDPTIFTFVNVVIPAIAIDPTSPSTIYVATNANGHTSGAAGGSGSQTILERGIWKSTDGGNTWVNLDPSNSGGGNSATDILLDPQKPSRIFAAIQSLGVFVFDGTQPNPTWQHPTANPLPTSGFTRVILASGPGSTIFSIYAASDNSSILGIFRSTDGGITWTKLLNTPTSGQTNYNLALAVDPTNANVLFYGTQTSGTVRRSLDGGQTWSDISSGDGFSGGLHADTHVLVVSPLNHNVLFTGSDGGIWRTDNATANPVSWNVLNSTLNITQFQGLSLHPTDPNTILGGTQDNGTELYTGVPTWTHSQDGDGGFTVIDQSNPLVMYHTFFNVNNSGGSAQIGPQLSTNGGGSWVNKGCFGCTSTTTVGNFNPTDRVGFYAPMAQNTGFTGSSGNVIYFGTNRLYRSADKGTTWTGLGASSDNFGTDLANVTINGVNSLGRLSAIAAFPFSNNSPSTEIVWVGTSNGQVQVTTNAGALATATFTNVTASPLPNRFITDIGVDLSNPQRAIVTYSGFNVNTPNDPGHVFLTTNQGSTWTNISGNLPDVPVTSIAIDPNIANTFYIGTDIGVFGTADGGTTWVALNIGMPKVAVFMLRYHAATRTIVGATHGRGIFRLDVSAGVQSRNNQTITFGSLPDHTFGDSPFVINATSSSGLGVVLSVPFGRATVNGSTLTLNGAGTVTVQADQTGDATFNPASPVLQTFFVAKANQTITFGGLANKSFGDAPFNLAATSTSGLPVGFSVVSGPATINGNTVTIIGVGSVTIRASQIGDSNFNSASTIDQSFTVVKGNQTITFNQPANHAFGDPPFALSATSTSGLAVNFSVVSGPATINGTTVTITGVGSVTIRASQIGDSNFNSAPTVDRAFTVGKGSQTITFNQPANHTFGDAQFFLSASASSGLNVSFSVVSGPATLSGNGVTLTGAGTVTIQADQAGDASFNAAPSLQRTFTVAKANQTITFGALPNKLPTDPPFTISATASSGLAVSFSVVSGPATINGNTVTITGSGSVTIRASQIGDSNFNSAPTVDQSFSVGKGSQTITFDQPANHTFGDAQFFLSASASSGLNVSFSVVSGPAILSGNGVTLTGAGTVTIQADQAGNANFNAAPAVQRSFTVAKANQTITFGALANKTFGDPPFNVSGTATSQLTVIFSVASGNATINGNTVTLTGIGPITIQADQPGDNNFNAAPPVPQSFTVAKGQAFINLSNLIQIFDGTPKSVTASTTPPGLSGLTVTYNGSATPPTAIGKYSVVASLNNPNVQSPNSLGTLSIVGFSPIDSKNASPGGQNTAIVNPSGNNPGISANLNHTSGGVTAAVSVGIYSDNPTEKGLVNAGGGFVDVKVTSPNAGDTVVINYYYPNTVTPVNEAALQLYYFNGIIWQPVRGSGNSIPVKDTTNNLDGTVSGGKFTVTLDNTSSPKVSELTGTVFAATTAIMGDINGDNLVNVADLILMANILAGNFTPTPVQKDAADVSKDASNNITIGDLVTLANFLAGNTKTLPLGN